MICEGRIRKTRRLVLSVVEGMDKEGNGGFKASPRVGESFGEGFVYTLKTCSFILLGG
jgi:hypothetical protein